MINFFKKKQKIKNPEQLVIDLLTKITEKGDNSQSITLDTQLTDLGLDSTTYIKFLLKLEEEININIEKIVAQVDINTLTSVKDIVQILEKL